MPRLKDKRAKEKRPKRRRKKQTFSATKAVKANARELIGAPPPTRLEPDRSKTIRREGKHKPTFGKLLTDSE